ncbi:MAG: hypothetical protein K0S24_705 [Sphingobacterium sp.]|jgi:hypothetical protein|nr:hypothetical protein [Sphingobacterium sp.]
MKDKFEVINYGILMKIGYYDKESKVKESY